MRTQTKSYYDRREELRQALYRIEGAISRYKQNNEIAEIGIIAVELRGLLYNDALFLTLIQEKGFEPEIYTYEPPFLSDKLPPDLRRGLTHDFSGDCISLKRKKPWTYRVKIEDWLKIPIIYLKGNFITPERLINEVANTLGPAHYSRNISSTLLEMKTINIGGVPSYFRTLFTFTEILLKLGTIFLQKY